MPTGPDESSPAPDPVREPPEPKSRFGTVTSHELRTPLAAILSSVELLEDFDGRMPADERRELLGIIKASVHQLNALFTQNQVRRQLDAVKQPGGTDPA